MSHRKIFIYQLLPRLFGNKGGANKRYGTLEENGCGKFNDLTNSVLRKIKECGYSHVWYIGVLAHASKTDYTTFGIPQQFPEIVKGNAGSPYAIRDYYDVDPDLATNIPKRMQEFENLVSRTQKNGLKVIIDFVPNHVSRNYQSICKPANIADLGENDDKRVDFSPQNNFYYIPGKMLDIQFGDTVSEVKNYNEYPAKVTGNDCFTHQPSVQDWYETVKLNYGVDYQNGRTEHFDPIPDTWIKMKDILLYWAGKSVDGFRCDMAEMVPLAFWQWVIPQVKNAYPNILFLAEIYNPNVYRDFLRHNTFDFLYDKVGLYDVLRDVSCHYRPASDITFALQQVGDIQSQMLNFLENHDEQRLASNYFLHDGEKGKAAMIVTCCINRNPVMVYAGQEFGERGMDEEGFSGKDGRTTIFDYWSVDTLSRWNNNGNWDDKQLTDKEKKLRDFYCLLISLCNQETALSEGLFYDLMSANYENMQFDSTRLFVFLRGCKESCLLVIANFDDKPQECVVHIPTNAFSFFNLKSKENGKLTPLLRKGDEIHFTQELPIRIKLDAYIGEIYRISF
jgi:glycosidase